jgi:Ca-activated chloride channel family protein
MVNTVGLGSPTGSAIIDMETGRPRTDESGQPVVSRLNEELLQQLALATNGVYIRLTDVPAALVTLQDQYRNVEKKALVDTTSLNYESFYIWFLLPVFLLLLAELFIPDRKKVVA